jgi:hypothetical protein
LEIFKDVKNFSLGLTSTTNAAPYLWWCLKVRRTTSHRYLRNYNNFMCAQSRSFEAWKSLWWLILSLLPSIWVMWK